MNISVPDLIAALNQLHIPITPDIAVALLRSNFSGLALIDMGGDDYTMTDAEATCAIIAPYNVGDGTKILKVPQSADGYYPSLQVVITLYATNDFIMETFDGLSIATITPSIATIAVVNRDIGIVDIGNLLISSYGGTTILDPGSNAFDSFFNFGKLFVASDILPQDLTISSGIISGNGKFMISVDGVGGLTVLAGDGVTILGNPVFVSGDSATIYRVGQTDTYRIVR